MKPIMLSNPLSGRTKEEIPETGFVILVRTIMPFNFVIWVPTLEEAKNMLRKAADKDKDRFTFVDMKGFIPHVRGEYGVHSFIKESIKYKRGL